VGSGRFAPECPKKPAFFFRRGGGGKNRGGCFGGGGGVAVSGCTWNPEKGGGQEIFFCLGGFFFPLFWPPMGRGWGIGEKQKNPPQRGGAPLETFGDLRSQGGSGFPSSGNILKGGEGGGGGRGLVSGFSKPKKRGFVLKNLLSFSFSSFSSPVVVCGFGSLFRGGGRFFSKPLFW